MPLIVEDGSIVPGTNSYVTVPEIKAYCEQRGLELPSTDSEIEILAVNAFDYVEQFGDRYAGFPTTSTQRTSWPREGVVINRVVQPSNEIPWQLKEAQCQATSEAFAADLMPNPGQTIKREKVDVLETEYADPVAGSTGGVSFPKIERFLNALFGRRGGGYRVRVTRG